MTETERIIWHNANEEPQENAKIIWYGGATGDCIKMCTHKKDMVHGGMTKWAYAEELLNLKTQEPIESLPKIKGWVARDKKWFDEENRLTFFFTKPERHTSILAVSEGWWNAKSDEHCSEGFRIDKNLFPELTWEDEPIEVELIIKHC